MTFDRTVLLQVKKSRIHNGKRLCYFRDYVVNDEEACREICVMRLKDKSAYRVWHYDFLEKFVDVPDMHFHYENFEFDTFEQAIEFVEVKFGISLTELR